MARLWKALVLVVALAVIPCEAHRPPRYEDIVDRAIEAYNNGRPGKPLFRLVDATQPSGQEERDCTVQFLRRGRSTYLTLSCDTDCSRQGAQVKDSPDYTVEDVSEKDQLKDLPPEIRNIYENAKFDIINNILHNF
ncbi:15 kDa protein A [Cricetulus griseus]|uniref:15 kDa protein A n=1 Tax=Cricetulus griseus TaxID=10029 RepID=G3HKR6_CRIGR|nr:15 kDa protein A [Cricetulus griseus]